MKKSVNVDIQNLFKNFGGNPEDYREIKREAGDARALRAWPIVAAMKNELQSDNKPGAEAVITRPHIPAPVPVASVVRQPAPVPAEPHQAEVSPSETHSTAGIPIRSLLGLVKAADDSSRGQSPSAQAGASRKDDTLEQVFMRLSNPSANSSASSSPNNLRSMLGFAKK